MPVAEGQLIVALVANRHLLSSSSGIRECLLMAADVAVEVESEGSATLAAPPCPWCSKLMCLCGNVEVSDSRLLARVTVYHLPNQI